MDLDSLVALLPAAIFLLWVLKRPIDRLRRSVAQRREAERYRFKRDYEPIEPGWR